MRLGDKAIANNGLHGLPDGSEIVLIGMDYEEENREMFLFKSVKGIIHHLHESEFKWKKEALL